MKEKPKCIVCGKSNAVKMSIMDGYMDTGEFNVCSTGCYRKIVAKGVSFWKRRPNQ